MTSPPPLDEQLILELEGWKPVMKGVQVFPYSRCSRFTFPLDEHLVDPLGQASVHCEFRLRLHRTVVHGWERWQSIWWVAHPLLQEADVEDIMELGTRRSGEADSHVVDELRDAVGPEEAWLQLPFGRLGQRRYWAMA